MLNDRASVASPNYWVETIPGLQSLPDAEDLRDLATGRSGEIARRSVRRGKTITYNGSVRARSAADMRSGMAALTAAFQDMVEGQMVITPNPSYAPGVTRTYNARALSCDPGDEVLDPNARWPFQMPFVIGLRMSDPRFYDPTPVAQDTASIIATTGLVLPVVAPFVIPSSGAAAGTVVVTNPGNTDADPVVDIYGPITDPVLTDLTLGRTLVFTGVTLGSTDFIRANFATRQVLFQGTSDYRSSWDALASSWWDPGQPGLPPGNTTVQLGGTLMANPAHAHVVFSPAYIS
jgi:hypothetical protein